MPVASNRALEDFPLVAVSVARIGNVECHHIFFEAEYGNLYMGSTGPVLHRLLIFLSVGPSAAGSELSRLYI